MQQTIDMKIQTTSKVPGAPAVNSKPAVKSQPASKPQPAAKPQLQPWGLGYRKKMYPITSPTVDLLLCAKFQLCRSNSVAAYRERSHSYLYYKVL